MKALQVFWKHFKSFPSFYWQTKGQEVRRDTMKKVAQDDAMGSSPRVSKEPSAFTDFLRTDAHETPPPPFPHNPSSPKHTGRNEILNVFYDCFMYWV